MQPGRAVPSSCTGSWLGLGFSCCWRNHTTRMMAFMLDVGYRTRYPLSNSLKNISVLSSLLLCWTNPWFSPFLPARAVSLNKTLPSFWLRFLLSWLQAHHPALPGPGSTVGCCAQSHPWSLPCPQERQHALILLCPAPVDPPCLCLPRAPTNITFFQNNRATCVSIIFWRMRSWSHRSASLPAQVGGAAGFGLPAPGCVPGGELGMGRGECLASACSSGFEL